ncbi:MULTISPECIES: hypothetical protein [Streptomyces]|uniref:Transmembrane protein n=1 Tax=Streptomyces yunnanensis TaxID=156453 RepID=A0ABY8A943_9ACTN|nr:MULTISPECIES: hypothetical protein [Streptomyces]AJC57195.1 hypothetical protein GZL_04617 [Streptomyces sp. 769]WEB41483.1 hypothetical protein MOV08_20905 [Streptomyces yunnanensis]
MNSAPHLLNEDRAEFARILDDALRTAAHHPDGLTATTGNRLSTEQLRTMALSATSAIAACATAEYQRYIQLRAELRAPAPAASAAGAGTPSADQTSDEQTGPATADDDPAAETTGFGLAAMATVLVPVLAGIAAVLFLVIGYVLRAVDPDPAVSRPLVSVGWIFAALAAAGALVAMGCVVVTALRNGVSRDTAAEARAAALDSARETWRQALLDRGLLPFLREALADPAADPADDPVQYVPRPVSAPERRTPTLGYTRPRFSSPDAGTSWSRPRYSSPDFTSPDYGGPDHRPE